MDSLNLGIYIVIAMVCLSWCWGGLHRVTTKTTRTVERGSHFSPTVRRVHFGPRVVIAGWVTLGSGVVGIILWPLVFVGWFPGGLFFLMLIAAAFIQTMLLPPAIPITPEATKKHKTKRLAEDVSDQDNFFHQDETPHEDSESMRR